jgi:Nucleotidyl transferase AbiEii toxin, Type IV TA system
VSRAAAWDPALAHEVPVAPIAPGTETAVHLQCLAISTALSRHYVKRFITPEKVIDVLNAAGVRFMLAGAHGIGGWMNEARTTQDVDVLVATRHLRPAVQALRTAFPRLTVNDTPVVTRFAEPTTGKVVLDVMKPNQPLHRVAMRHAYRIQTPKRAYDIPTLEFALAMKFAATVSPWRERKRKMQDAVDFAWIVEANPVIDLGKMAQLGQLVYPGGGKEIVKMVRRVRAGERLEL